MRTLTVTAYAAIFPAAVLYGDAGGVLAIVIAILLTCLYIIHLED